MSYGITTNEQDILDMARFLVPTMEKANNTPGDKEILDILKKAGFEIDSEVDASKAVKLSMQIIRKRNRRKWIRKEIRVFFLFLAIGLGFIMFAYLSGNLFNIHILDIFYRYDTAEKVCYYSLVPYFLVTFFRIVKFSFIYANQKN